MAYLQSPSDSILEKVDRSTSHGPERFYQGLAICACPVHLTPLSQKVVSSSLSCGGGLREAWPTWWPRTKKSRTNWWRKPESSQTRITTVEDDHDQWTQILFLHLVQHKKTVHVYSLQISSGRIVMSRFFVLLDSKNWLFESRPQCNAVSIACAEQGYFCMRWLVLFR